MLAPNAGTPTGFFPSKTTASESIPSTRSKSLEYSNAFTVSASIQVQAWGLRSAKKSLSVQGERSGLNPSSGSVQRFILPSPSNESDDKYQPLLTILLAEDNPADARLVREALAEHGVQGEL